MHVETLITPRERYAGQTPPSPSEMYLFVPFRQYSRYPIGRLVLGTSAQKRDRSKSHEILLGGGSTPISPLWPI